VKAEVNRMITVLQLERKRDTASKNLSGGMKRKLCVGIALISDSKVNDVLLFIYANICLLSVAL